MDLRETGAEQSARDGKGGAPHNGADEVGEKKHPDVHPRYTRGNRNHTTNAGQKLGYGYLEERFSGEAISRALDIPTAEQSPSAIALDPLLEAFLSQRVPDVVERKAAEDGTDGSGSDDSE